LLGSGLGGESYDNTDTSDDDDVLSTFTIRFESNGGSTVNSQRVYYGSRATRPNDPTKEGYTFAGWYIDAGFTMPFDFNTPITRDITLYAKWEINKYTVTFYDTIEEKELFTIEVAYNSLIEEPEAPEKEGYKFVGWYKEPEYINEWDFEADRVTLNLTLYAKWIKSAIELIPDEDTNFVDYNLEIGFVPNDDWINSITSVQIKRPGDDEFAELDEGEDGYIIYPDPKEELYLLEISSSYITVPGTYIIRVEAEGYEVSEVEQEVFLSPAPYATEVSIYLNGVEIDEEEITYGNTYTFKIKVLGENPDEDPDAEDFIAIAGLQLYANIGVYSEDYSIVVDGNEYTYGEHENIKLRSKTDSEGIVEFTLSIPEDDPDIEEEFSIVICASKDGDFMIYSYNFYSPSKPAIELMPDEDLNFVDYNLQISFEPYADWIDSIASLK